MPNISYLFTNPKNSISPRQVDQAKPHLENRRLYQLTLPARNLQKAKSTTQVLKRTLFKKLYFACLFVTSKLMFFSQPAIIPAFFNLTNNEIFIFPQKMITNSKLGHQNVKYAIIMVCTHD